MRRVNLQLAEEKKNLLIQNQSLRIEMDKMMVQANKERDQIKDEIKTSYGELEMHFDTMQQ